MYYCYLETNTRRSWKYEEASKDLFKQLATTCASSYERGIDTREIDVLSAAIFIERVYEYVLIIELALISAFRDRHATLAAKWFPATSHPRRVAHKVMIDLLNPEEDSKILYTSLE